MVGAEDSLLRRAEAAVAAVPDPELPFLTIAELGMVRGVTITEGQVEVALSPTYTGCPATAVIAAEVAGALDRAGIPGARVRTVLAPAWTTDWITAAGRSKLLQAGIVPPPTGAARPALFEAAAPPCPACLSPATERLSAFGSTPCKALYRCTACREPFEFFKCL